MRVPPVVGHLWVEFQSVVQYSTTNVMVVTTMSLLKNPSSLHCNSCISCFYILCLPSIHTVAFRVSIFYVYHPSIQWYFPYTISSQCIEDMNSCFLHYFFTHTILPVIPIIHFIFSLEFYVEEKLHFQHYSWLFCSSHHPFHHTADAVLNFDCAFLLVTRRYHDAPI